MPALPDRWLPLLAYLRDLHRRSRHAPTPPLPHPWEEIGPGYCYGPAFGHWDIVHQIADVVAEEPDVARLQVLNDLANQQADGFLPGSIWMRDGGMPWQKDGERRGRWNTSDGHPPVWPVAVDLCRRHGAGRDLLAPALAAARRQLAWFRAQRAAPDGGYFYADLTLRRWESGVDEGVRFDDCPREPATCIDATCHVAMLCQRAAAWAAELGEDGGDLAAEAERLGRLVRTRLWCEETGFFHDAWSVADPSRRRLCVEGFWPLIGGLAAPEQAARLIDGSLLDPRRFLTVHPVPSVAVCEPSFSLRMWRGPTWNSMTWWIADGCRTAGRADAAARIAGLALDAAAAVFARTGTVWEFYHPHGGDPGACQRKPHTPYNQPCRDYLGHAPFLALARLWSESSA